MTAGISLRGTFSFSIPNSASSSGVIGLRRPSKTSATSSMYGLSASRSNHSSATFAQHRRSERPKGFAVLHLQVEYGLHARRSRVAQDRSGAERARAELHAPLKPAHALFRPPALPRRLAAARRRPGLHSARRRRLSRRSISDCENAGPRYEPFMRSHPVTCLGWFWNR